MKGAGTKKSKLAVARTRMHAANKRENEWAKQFYLMRDQRDELKRELKELKQRIFGEW